jgi:hypothetical protein
MHPRSAQADSLGRRDTIPAALHYSSTTQADSWGLLGSHEDNKLEPKPFALFEFGAKVARRRHLSKRAGSGSTPAASTNLSHFDSTGYFEPISAAATGWGRVAARLFPILSNGSASALANPLKCAPVEASGPLSLLFHGRTYRCSKHDLRGRDRTATCLVRSFPSAKEER